MSLRALQFTLIGLLVAVAGWQWRRDLGLRADYAAEGATRAKLTADLASARAEGVAPAVIGRRLDSLEARLGVKLLQRTTRNISLTN